MRLPRTEELVSFISLEVLSGSDEKKRRKEEIGIIVSLKKITRNLPIKRG